MGMEYVGIYNRCSTEEECQVNALAIQVEESVEIAHGMAGWHIVEQYVEAQSGTTSRHRAEYLRMMTDIEAHKFTVIMIKSIDRLVRNTKDWYLFLDCIVRNHVKLYIYLEHKFYTPDDSLITGIKAILAEEFSRELSKKIKNAHKRRQEKRSGLNISSEMFGWDKVQKDVYEINEKEAAFYRLAFELAEQGYGFRRISNKLYELGARSRTGKQISEVQWRNLLRSPRAHGTAVLRKYEYDFERKKRIKLPPEQWIYVENAFPPIVSREYHETVLALLDERAFQCAPKIHAPGCPGNTGKHAFSGKLICGVCGSTYYRAPVRYTTGIQEDWRCSAYLARGRKTEDRSGGCNNIRVDEPGLYRLLEEAWETQCSTNPRDDRELVEEAMDILRKVLDNSQTQRELKKLERQLDKLKTARARLLDRLMEGVINDRDFQVCREKNDLETETVEAKLADLKQHLSSCDHKQEARLELIRDVLQNGSVIHRARVRERMDRIENIVIYPDGTLQIRSDKALLQTRYVRVTKSGQQRLQQKEGILRYIRKHEHAKTKELTEFMGLKPGTVYSRLRELCDEGKVRHAGFSKDGYWEYVNNNADRNDNWKDM